MAAIRARQLGTENYWQNRIGFYLSGEHSPQQALAGRAAFVAADGPQIIGFIAGHRTQRYQCDAELEWIDTIAERRRQGVAGALLEVMAWWFVEQNAHRVCVDVDPANSAVRALYTRYGARQLNSHWMVWEDINIVRTVRPPFER
jgi:GNAT superfamily N-acetyltransferase